MKKLKRTYSHCAILAAAVLLLLLILLVSQLANKFFAERD